MADVLIISYSQADSAVQYVQQLFEGFGDTVSHAVDTSFTPSIVQNYDLVIAMRLKGGNSISKDNILEILNYDKPVIGGIYAYYGVSEYTNNWESESGLVSSVVNTNEVDVEFTITNKISDDYVENQVVDLLGGYTYSDSYKGADLKCEMVGFHSTGASILKYEAGTELANGRILNNRVLLHGLLHNYNTPTADGEQLALILRNWVLAHSPATITGLVQKEGAMYDNCIIKALRESDYKLVASSSPVNGEYSMSVPIDQTYTVICEDLDIDAPLSPLVGVGVKGEL